MSSTLDKKSNLANRMWRVSAFLLAALLGWVSLQSHRQVRAEAFPQAQLEIARADGSKASFVVEVARTHRQQERGLMFRRTLAPNAGMLFVWETDQPVSMWMKNTLIPLDMLFVARDGRIAKVIANAAPHDLTPLSSGEPVRAVIEIGGGEAARQSLQTGDKVLFSAFLPAP